MTHRDFMRAAGIVLIGLLCSSRWGGVVQPGATSDRVISSPDLFPTLLAACDLPPAPSAADGVSFLPTLHGEAQSDRRPVFWHYPHYGNQGGFPGGAIRDGDWKLIERYEDGLLELYHLRDDVGETNNLAAGQPERTQRLLAKLMDWRKDVGALMPAVRSISEPAPSGP